MKKIITIIILLAIAFGIVHFYKNQPRQAPEGVEGFIEQLVVEKDLPRNVPLVGIERIENPSKTYTAILIGPKGGSPVGIMVIEGENIKRSYVAQGDWKYLSIKNVVWERENSISFEEVASLDGATESIKKTLTIR